MEKVKDMLTTKGNLPHLSSRLNWQWRLAGG
jgi:hypothetical protein